MAKTLEPIVMKSWDSDEVHSGFVDYEGEAMSWCGTLREHGDSEVIVFTGLPGDVTCERCRGQQPSQVAANGLGHEQAS